MESCAPNPVMPSPRKRVLDAAVHRERAAGRLRRPVGGEEEHRLGDVLGEDPDTEKVALAVELLELGDRDPLGGRALVPDLLGPELESWKTASGLTMFERIPWGAPSSARTFASCA